jgi:hypothetical protein
LKDDFLSTTLLSSLRSANAELRKHLAAGPPEVRPEAPPTVLVERLELLSERLERVARELPENIAPASPETPTQAEIHQYMKNLEEVRTILETLRATLAQERNRLQGEGAHLQAAPSGTSSMRAPR